MRALFNRCNVWKRWVQVYQNGMKTEDYFKARNINRIAVYGMSDIGNSFVDDLVGTGVVVAYGIDKIKGACKCNIEMRSPYEVEDDVDMIVVTAITAFPSIYNELNAILKNRVPVVGVDEILISLLVEKDEMEK